MNKNFTRVLYFSLATLFTCSCSDEGKIEPIQMPDANGSASLPKCEGNQLYDTQLQKCVEPPNPKSSNDSKQTNWRSSKSPKNSMHFSLKKKKSIFVYKRLAKNSNTCVR